MVKKKLILGLVDISSIFLAMIMSYAFLSEYITQTYKIYFIFFVCVVSIYLIVGIRIKIYSMINRYLCSKDIFKLLLLTSLAYLISGCSIYVFIYPKVSLRYIILSGLLSLVFIVVPRLLWKQLVDVSNRKKLKNGKLLKILVIGAGEGGRLFFETSKNDPNIDIVAYLDDDPKKIGKSLYGIEIFGGNDRLAKVVRRYQVDQVVIAAPSIKGEVYHHFIDLCNQIGVSVKKMPSVEDVVSGRLEVKTTRDIEISDLLGREEIKLNQESIESELLGATVLVTGAGGSIGSEICRQLIKFNLKKLVLLGHGENSIYQIHRELTYLKLDNLTIIPVIADIQDEHRLNQVMEEQRPDYVYHAAAHKHVPLMEENPYEAVKNNIYGTRNVALAAKKVNVKKFVMISTDKAVNPPNVMGATKRIAEMVVTNLNEEVGTKFVAVRFGNVLGSRGSVVPLFKEQIAKGGPLTVTDFRMTRYFMTIPEASRLVIQAGVLARGGEIFVLDMGEPVKIVDLAKNIIRLSGYTEEQIHIKETGIRPGEKLYEELLSSEEFVDKQVFDKIFIGKVTPINQEVLADFIQALDSQDTSTLRKSLIEFANQR
ncbi:MULTISPECIES: nucleoside-diphosphate sugar epimerase/dehydratase [unclassified Granulicatella]|uniref:polysaccharide biosynthesis protein n=1 Tax=unclassified Granulicatella TaxID=2630493 RepID=UPI001D16B92D|nr:MULTISPECIES: nucleoside-diphosphate sugar epimerase/dehydratase [unclassified Granulicatella]